jgi:hypothetical protein
VEKQPTSHGPEGCDENGPAAVLRPRDRHVSIQICSAPRPAMAGPAAHFERNESHIIYETGDWIHS